MSPATHHRLLPRRWPIPTAEVRDLLGTTEAALRYALRAGVLAEDERPLDLAGRLLWYPQSVLSLLGAMVDRGLGGLDSEGTDALRAALRECEELRA